MTAEELTLPISRYLHDTGLNCVRRSMNQHVQLDDQRAVSVMLAALFYFTNICLSGWKALFQGFAEFAQLKTKARSRTTDETTGWNQTQIHFSPVRQTDVIQAKSFVGKIKGYGTFILLDSTRFWVSIDSMPRRKRISKGNIVYHVLNRANGRLRIFRKKQDFAAFEKILADGIDKFNMRLCG